MAGKEDQIKTEIAVDGEQEYKKACKEIDASLKAIASEMKVVSATFEGNADSIEAMTAKQDVLNKRLEEQKKKVAEAEAALKKYQDAGQGTSEAAKKMETNLNYARAAMIKTENEIRNLDAGLDEARNASNDFSDGLEDISQEHRRRAGRIGRQSFFRSWRAWNRFENDRRRRGRHWNGYGCGDRVRRGLR